MVYLCSSTFLPIPSSVLTMCLLGFSSKHGLAMKLSKRTIDGAASGTKDMYYWDNDLKGYGLKVTPPGKKVFLIQYRLGGRGGRSRRYTIGPYGSLTPDQGRVEARRLLGLIASGVDPADERDRKRFDLKMGALLDRFVSEHVVPKLKRRTAEEYIRSIDIHIRPRLAHRLVSDVKKSEISRLHHSMRDKPFQANRVLALLSKFFNWCEKNGFREDGTNPCRHVDKYKERQRERFLNHAELLSLGEVLKLAEEQNLATPWAIAAIRLLSLTGARLSEILTLKWEYLDFAAGVARLPDSKTGAKTIYLSPPALELLNELQRLEGNPYVICGLKEGRHLVNLQKPWTRIRELANMSDVRIHDLRHSFASIAVSSGMSLPMIGALLGHSQPQTTARYAHLADDPLKLASSGVADRIYAAMNIAPDSKAIVVDISTRRL